MHGLKSHRFALRRLRASLADPRLPSAPLPQAVGPASQAPDHTNFDKGRSLSDEALFAKMNFLSRLKRSQELDKIMTKA